MKDLKNALQSDGAINATLRNSIMSASDPSNLYMLTFHSYFPAQVLFYSYGTTVTLEVEFNNNGKPTSFTLKAGESKIISIPTGTTQFDANATSIIVTKPDYAYICTTF